MQMFRLIVQIAYGTLCAVMLAAYARDIRIPNDSSWFEIDFIIFLVLSLSSLVSFLSKRVEKYVVLAVCSGCLLVIGLWSLVDVVVRVANNQDDYVPSGSELLLHFVFVVVPLAMLIVAIGRYKVKLA
jgi:uncharacterized membrane protein